MVDTDGIDAELLHEIGIKLTLSGIHEGIVLDQLVGNTWQTGVNEESSIAPLAVRLYL